MKVYPINNTNQNFGSTYNKNLEVVIDTLAKKGYSKLNQGHLDTLIALKTDGLKNVSLNIDYSFPDFPRLIVESELINKGSDLVATVLEKVREYYGIDEPRILDASIEAAAETLKLCSALKGDLSYENDFISQGIDLSRHGKPYTKEEQFCGLTKFDIDIDKLLEMLDPKNKIPEKLVRFHNKLLLQTQRTRANFAKFMAISKSN